MPGPCRKPLLLKIKALLSRSLDVAYSFPLRGALCVLILTYYNILRLPDRSLISFAVWLFLILILARTSGLLMTHRVVCNTWCNRPLLRFPWLIVGTQVKPFRWRWRLWPNDFLLSLAHWVSFCQLASVLGSLLWKFRECIFKLNATLMMLKKHKDCLFLCHFSLQKWCLHKHTLRIMSVKLQKLPPVSLGNDIYYVGYYYTLVSSPSPWSAILKFF